MAITFRGDDDTRWGTGQGSDLSAEQIDINFWELYSAVTALQDHANDGAFIDFFNVSGNNLYVHMTDHSVLGPYTLPVAQWNFVGPWQPEHVYAVMDTFNGPDGGVYVVIYAHTSGSDFDAGANDGMGHDFYAALLSPPDSLMPAGGTTAQRLAKIDSHDYNAEWVDEPVRIGVFIEGQPTPTELLMRFSSTDTFTFPAGMASSRSSCETAPHDPTALLVYKNDVFIGSIFFDTAQTVAAFENFDDDVTFVPGDVLTIVGPGSPDATHADISVTLVGAITG